MPAVFLLLLFPDSPGLPHFSYRKEAVSSFPPDSRTAEGYHTEKLPVWIQDSDSSVQARLSHRVHFLCYLKTAVLFRPQKHHSQRLRYLPDTDSKRLTADFFHRYPTETHSYADAVPRGPGTVHRAFRKYKNHTAAMLPL